AIAERQPHAPLSSVEWVMLCDVKCLVQEVVHDGGTFLLRGGLTAHAVPSCSVGRVERTRHQVRRHRCRVLLCGEGVGCWCPSAAMTRLPLYGGGGARQRAAARRNGSASRRPTWPVTVNRPPSTPAPPR